MGVLSPRELLTETCKSCEEKGSGTCSPREGGQAWVGVAKIPELQFYDHREVRYHAKKERVDTSQAENST